MRAPRGTHLAFHSHLSTPLLCWASRIQSSVPPSQAGEESLFPWFSGSWPTLVICSQFPNTLGVRLSTLAGSQGHGQKTLLSSHDTWGIVEGHRGGLAMQTGPQAAPSGLQVPHDCSASRWSFQAPQLLSGSGAPIACLLLAPHFRPWGQDPFPETQRTRSFLLRPLLLPQAPQGTFNLIWRGGKEWLK